MIFQGRFARNNSMALLNWQKNYAVFVGQKKVFPAFQYQSLFFLGRAL